MFISPVALLTYTTVYIAEDEFFPSSLSEDKIPYKTRDDIVAITGLDDFPAFTYRNNVVTYDLWGDIVLISIMILTNPCRKNTFIN